MKPILSKETSYAFDSKNEHIIKFYVQDNSKQTIKNRIVIRNNLSNLIVYDKTIETLQLKHTIPQNTLTNGILYNIVVQTIDSDNNKSELSEPLLFYCYSTPSFTLSITENQIIENSSISVGVNYSQTEGEELQLFKVQLFDHSKTLLTSSDDLYSISNTTFNGLTDNSTYYLKAIGQTVNHMQIETDYIPFNVDYKVPNFYAYAVAENRYKYGDIQISSNLISIEGACNEPIYINDSYIDTINGTKVSFNNGFNLNQDFTLYFNGYNFQYNKMLLYISDDNDISIYWRKEIPYGEDVYKYYAELICNKDSNTPYIIRSNYISLTDDEIVGIWIVRNRGYFRIHTYNESQVY